MKERPIPMNTAMVCATLDGSKRQTRRICKPAEAASLSRVVPAYKSEDGEQRPPYITAGWFGDEEGDVLFCCPHGVPGDRLYVRESARVLAVRGGVREIDIEYQADKSIATVPYPSRLAPAPLGKMLANGTYREASRILLEIIGVRVERLQDISEEDAITEGIEQRRDWMWRDYLSDFHAQIDPVGSYRTLWESINGAGSWDANPWVWVIEFKMVKP